MKYVVTVAGHEHTVDLAPAGGASRHAVLKGDRHELNAVCLSGGVVSLIIDGQVHDVDFERPSGSDALDARVNVRIRGQVFRLEVLEERRKRLRETAARGAHHSGSAQVTAPMPGKVVKVLKQRGAEVQAGEGVVVVEAMKMENELRAPASGVISEVRVQEGQAVEANAVLVVIAAH
jgi:biotin carboxyl carrier protein